MPLKQDVLPYLERTDPLSAKIGAVNTISRMPDGKFYGFNTDVQGIILPLERRLPLANAKVLVLGAGGAARAAVFGCRDKGAEVFICNRTPETAQKLAKQSGAKVIKREALAKTSFDFIINATPIGMAGLTGKGVPTSPLESAEINARFVFDLIYNPLETPFLRLARQKGATAISGVEMFVTQGARQFEIWTGKPAPEEEMLRVVLHSLRQGVEPVAELPPLLQAAAPAAPESALPAPVAPKPAPVAAKPAPQPTITIKAPAKKVIPAAKKSAPVVSKAKSTLKKPVAKPTPTKVSVKVTTKTKLKAKAR
jgi:3-dehydroquinate dehydratase/shikimate dehydrogenase